ncbi:phosphatase PAP2 family protein [Petrimonas sp.]|uniref:phosphatase PAP2 family protein n=1 Tax=Petrimonas sp. TaxID=2023866 RepID=UPI003F516B18
MKEAVENLLPFERDLFFALNGSDSLLLDNVFWTFTGRYVWILLWLFLLVMFFHKTHRREGILTAVFFILVIVVCDQVSSGFFKPFFERFRPTHHPDFQNLVDIVNGYRGGTYGFISGHATNSFGIAVFMTFVFRNRWVTIPVLVWAALNSYSRIYLGVHFISDIVAGAIIGSLLGWLMYVIYSQIRRRFYQVPYSKRKLSPYSHQHGKFVGIVMSAYILLIIIFSSFLATLPH